MFVPMPRRRGKAVPAAAWLSALTLAPAAFAQSPVVPVAPAAPPPPAAPVPTAPPTPSPSVAQISSPPTILVSPAVTDRPLAGAHNLLVRLAPQPMGDNTAVRLWLRGDGGGENVRVRLYAAPAGVDAGQAALTAPEWVSEALPVTWSGWREVVLGRDKFTLRDPGLGLDMDLPAGDQPVSVDTPPAPHWADINVIGLETGVPKRAALGVDDVAWVTLDSNGTGQSETTVDDFETGDVAAWQSVGTDAQRQALSYGVTTAPSQVHGGHVAFHLAATAPAAARLPLLASARREMARSHRPYLVWTPADRFEPILPTSLPPAIGANSDLSLQAAPGQTLGAGVCLYSARALSGVTVTMPDGLQGVGHALPPSAADVRVVKVTPEPGGGMLRDDDFAAPLPDLLVKDDRVPLSGVAPALRLTGAPVTDIPADSVKEFWVTLSVPTSARPADYAGELMVSGKGLAAPVLVRVTLTVLPLPLASSPAKQYAIGLRSRLDPAPATLPSADGRDLVTDFVDKDTLDAQLADIRAHGFNIATLYDSLDTVGDAEAEYVAQGFGTPYNLYMGDGDPAQVAAVLGGRGAPKIEFFVDPNDADRQARVEALGKHGMAVATYITRLSDFTALQASLDVPVYSADSDYSRSMLRTDGARVNAAHDWWYWPAAQESPLTDRMDAGWSLWRANLYGAFVPDYQTAFGVDPYDLDSAGAAPGNAMLRSQMLTYPAQGGVLDTLRWEAVREGVTDVLYLTTMFQSLRQCKDLHVAKPLTDAASAYVDSFLDKSPQALTDADLDAARAQVAHYTLLMNAQVAAYDKAHHITP